MLIRLKKLAEIEILIAIASAIFGLLVSPLFEKITSPLFDTPTRALLTGLFFLALLVIIAVAATGVFARRYEQIIAKVNGELSSINRRLGLTVRFVHDPPKRSTGEVYRVARKIIEKAEKEILVLYYLREREERETFSEYASDSIETEEYRIERERYMQAVLEKVRQSKTVRHFYRRIFQFPEGRDAKFTEDRVGKRWYEHVTGVLQVLDDYSDAGYIKKASLFLGQTYVIVDRRYIIWGIDSIDPEQNVRYMEGALFFDDPNQEFVPYLIGFFQRVDANAIIVRNIPEE